jgi:hypothetical protein
VAQNFRKTDVIDLRRDKGAILVGRLYADPTTRPLSGVYEAALIRVVEAVLESWKTSLSYKKAEAAVRFVESEIVDPAITNFSLALARAAGKEDYTSLLYTSVFKNHVSTYRAPREREQEKKLKELIANAEPLAESNDVVAFHLPKLRAALALQTELLDLFDTAADPNAKTEAALAEAIRLHDVQWASIEGELIKLFPTDRHKQRSFHPPLRSRSSSGSATTEELTEPTEPVEEPTEPS